MEKVFARYWFTSPLPVAVARTSQSPFPLCDTLFEQSYQNSANERKMNETANASKKTKEVHPTHQATALHHICFFAKPTQIR